MENMNIDGEFNPEAVTNTVTFEHKGRLFRFEAYTSEALNEDAETLNLYCRKICEEIAAAIDNANNHIGCGLYHDFVYGNIVEKIKTRRKDNVGKKENPPK